jgi:hypothetical protein
MRTSRLFRRVDGGWRQEPDMLARYQAEVRAASS